MRCFASKGQVTTFAMVLLLVVAMAGLGVVWMSKGMVSAGSWPVKFVELDGSFRRVTKEQFRTAIQPYVGANFFTLDLEKIRASVEELAWVESAVVRKSWPDTLEIRFEEHQPVARWKENYLVNEKGQVFRMPEGYIPDALPELWGPDEQSDEVIAVHESFRKTLLTADLHLASLYLTNRGSWRAVLVNGTELKLGRQFVNERLERFVSAFSAMRLEDRRMLETADLRYPHGMAVTWHRNDMRLAGNG